MKKLRLSTRSLALAAALGALSLGTVGHAQTPPPPPPEAGEHADPNAIAQHHLDHLTKALNLTADQQASVKPILVDEAKRDQRTFAELRAHHEKARAKIEGVLTPDQKAKFAALIAKREAKREEKHEAKKEHHWKKAAKKDATASTPAQVSAPAPAAPAPEPAPAPAPAPAQP